ncbi:MAG: hypothetical protein HQ491_09470 [Bacteroidetes bacterium]|nr:hypothetical protein [Bacteroidota bacterium]
MSVGLLWSKRGGEKIIVLHRIVRHCLPAVQDDTCKALKKICFKKSTRDTHALAMNDWFKIDINFPVPGFSCLPFITLLPIAIGTGQCGTTDIKGLCP